VEDELEMPDLPGTNGGDVVRDGGASKLGHKHVFLDKTHADPLRRHRKKKINQI
jgi:hypothetical protein